MIVNNLAYFLRTPRAWRALVSWPKFSVTSHRMVWSLMQQCINPVTVIDVGANVGQFAVSCAKSFTGVTVHSFEPHPECVKKLRQNTAKMDNVHLYPVALGARHGEVLFHINAHSHSSSILPLAKRHRTAFPHAQQVATITVPLSTLDRELGRTLLASPVLLKLDVQGYESQVLEGATETLNRVNLVLIEVSFSPLYEGEKTFMEIASMLAQFGFEFLRPVDWLRDPNNGEVLQMDALFARGIHRK